MNGLINEYSRAARRTGETAVQQPDPIFGRDRIAAGTFSYDRLSLFRWF
jgi:hypothetical protein